MTIERKVNIVVFFSRMLGVIIDNIRGDPIRNLFPVIKITHRNTTAYTTTFPRVVFGLGLVEQLGDTPWQQLGNSLATAWQQLGNKPAWKLVWYVAWCRGWCRTWILVRSAVTGPQRLVAITVVPLSASLVGNTRGIPFCVAGTATKKGRLRRQRWDQGREQCR